MKKDKDNLGDRCKMYEMSEAGRKLIPLLPIMVRLDGHGFHSFTRGMERPYDVLMSRTMIETTKRLVEETGACIGYTQSDEISLVIYSDSLSRQTYFDGRIQKLTSLLAAKASVIFMKLISNVMPHKANLLPTFDCRVWNVPNFTEAVNTLIWRENDAAKNSISMLARAYFSHKEVDHKTGSEKQEMLFQKKGINWNECPDFFKRGTYVQRKKILRKFTCDEIAKLPPKHEAHTNSDLILERTEVKELVLKRMCSVVNRVDVVFFGEEPMYENNANI